jgi:hypothetical protein
MTKRGEPSPISQAMNRPRAKHPKMFQLWGLSLNQKSYYDPRKY